MEGRAVPVDRAGCYVPGGRGSYPSSVLMTAVPARVAGVPEVVRNGRTGVLVPPFDQEGWMHAMDGLLSDAARRRAMGRAAATHVRSEHDLDKNYRQVEAVLNALVSGRRRGAA